MAELLKGKEVREKILAQVEKDVQRAKKTQGVVPGLKVLLVGDDPASEVYVRNKARACERIGFHSEIEHLPSSVSQEKVLQQIDDCNQDDSIHGLLVQLPLPDHINEDRIIQSIHPLKDVDGFHPENVGRLCIGTPRFVPCTALGIIEILKYHDIEIEGKDVVILGRSNLVGKPLLNLLIQKRPYANATVTLCHSRTRNLAEKCRQADILVAAIGKPEFVDGSMVKEDSVIIDVGINRVEDSSREKGYRLVGDVKFADIEEKVQAITPVPGGVGPMTIASLMMNTWQAFKLQTGLE